jgi:hypothetical protein
LSLPRFLDRVVDSTVPVLGGMDRDAVRAKLEDSSVTLVAGERAAEGASRDGLLLTANLLARLYPRIRLKATPELAHAAENEIILVNPHADVSTDDQPTAATLAYEADAGDEAGVAVSAREWNVYVDVEAEQRGEPAAPAALAAAALGVGELFRTVFAKELGDHGRDEAQEGSFNLITRGAPVGGLPVPRELDVGSFRLVGAGAIGQMAAKAVALAGARGTLIAVDHDRIAISNLQRYVLARDNDVGAVKVDLLRERLNKSAIEVVPIPSGWHAELVEEQLPTLVALDSPEARIGVQASLPGPIYNAWTQPADVGWSRHETFGVEPCLACLYWPQRKAPSRHEQIGAAFHQHPLRVLAYLVHRLPVGLPLPPGGVPVVPGLEAPTEADQWLSTPLIDDIAAGARVDPAQLAAWRERPLADVYQDGICGGALLSLNVGEAPRDVLVPLAHQSALAGVMLATEFLTAQVPALASARSSGVEGRYDVLAGLPQVIARPRVRTEGCLCGDDVFRGVYGERLAQPVTAGPD